MSKINNKNKNIKNILRQNILFSEAIYFIAEKYFMTVNTVIGMICLSGRRKM